MADKKFCMQNFNISKIEKQGFVNGFLENKLLKVEKNPGKVDNKRKLHDVTEKYQTALGLAEILKYKVKYTTCSSLPDQSVRQGRVYISLSSSLFILHINTWCNKYMLCS